MARQLAASEEQRDEMVMRAIAGMTAQRIGEVMGFDDQTVRNTVRRLVPTAFRRSARKVAAFKPAAGAVSRRMPHQIGWSTDPTSHHVVSLPRLRCLS
jgi:predicted transcriptional regulator